MSDIAFYREKNLEGTPEYYNIGDDITFHQGDAYNDDYNSLDVISANAKVNCYQNTDGSGVFHVYMPGTYDNLDLMKGLSKFQVLPLDATFSISVKLQDNTGGAPGDYTMTFSAAGIATVDVLSDADDYTSLPSTASTDEITCAIYVRSNIDYHYAATGSVYLQYNATTGVITVTQTEDFPTNMSVTQDDATKFTFYLNSDVQ
jgi:hypothetical protein